MNRFLRILFDRHFFPERILFLAVGGGMLFDGWLTAVFHEWSVESFLRIFISFLAGGAFITTYLKFATRKMMRRMALAAIIFLISFSAFLNVIHHFDIDNAITFLGAYLICSLYFRALRELVVYLVFGFAVCCIALFFTTHPDIEPVLFGFRLFLGGLLVLSLSFATRQFQTQLQKFSQKIAEENRSLNETKSALEARLTHEHLLSLVASRSNTMVIISDKDDKIEWVNETYTQITGYSSADAIGKTPDFMRGPKTNPETGRRINERKKINPQAFHDSLLIYKKDGNQLWLQIHVTPLLDENGIPEKFISIGEDITEIKKTEEDLIHSREQLKTAQQQAKIGNWEWRDGSLEVIISDEMARMAGIPGKNIADTQMMLQLVHPDDVEKLRAAVEKGLREHVAFEIEFRVRVNDELKYVYLTAQAIYNSKDRTEKLFGTLQDITERKRIENEMLLAEKQYRSLFENSQHMICIHDLQGNMLSINPAGAKAIGVSEEKIVGASIGTIFWFDDPDGYEKYISTIREKGKAQGLLRLKKNKKERTVWLYNNILLTNSDGTPYILCSNVEITGRYEMEKELRKAKKLAEESLVLKDRFVTNISHELRTPMNAIIGFTDLLLKTNLTAEQKEYLESVHIAGDNLTSMINDVLDLAKIEAGKIEFESNPYNVRDVMAKTHRLLSQTAFQSHLKFDWECEKEVPAYVLGDELRLSQILINLVGNSIKFTEKGFVKFICFIKSETEDTIDLVFNVEDSGIGIPDDKVNDIFEPFTQVAAGSTRKFGGTGLGLSIVHDLVELQGGFISVKSQEGKGSSFTVILPVKKVNIELIEKVEKALKPVESPENVHVLIVEDQPLNQNLAKKLISDFGFTSEIAPNGKVAVELISELNLFEKNEKYDLILMDLLMPEMDGYEATEIIRKKLQLDIPIIALTAHSSVGEREKCLALGMNDYLVKPFRAQELYFKISSAVKKQVNEIPEKLNSGEEKNPLQELSGGDKKFEKEMLSMLIKSIAEDFESMISAMKEKDFSVARAVAHRLKSSIALSGEKEFAGMIEECEKSCSMGKIPANMEKEITDFTNRKENLIERLKKEVEELVMINN